MAWLLALTLTAGSVDLATIRSALEPHPATGWVMDAVRVGVTRDASRSTFIAAPSLGTRVDIAFAFWVLRGFDRVVLVDTGFVRGPQLDTWRIEEFRDPQTGLSTLGVDPGRVTDVVLTHHHWDHIGGLVRFPQATIWAHPRTISAVKGSRNEHAARVLRDAERDGRLRRTTSVQRIAPGLVTIPAGMHTPGFQFLAVAQPGGVWVLASDLVPLRANLVLNEPTGLTTDARGTLRVMAAMRALVDDAIERIVPGHEPTGFDERGVSHLAP